MKEILLEEYKTLKSEQLERIKHRDNIIYVALGAIGTLFSFAIIHQANYVVALIPMVSLVLCWLYISNDRKISEIGNYIENDLTQLFMKYLDKKKSGEDKQEEIAQEEIFYWEQRHTEYNGRRKRKIIQFIMDLLIFAFPSLISLFMISEKDYLSLKIVNVVFFLAIILLFITHYSKKEITKEGE